MTSLFQPAITQMRPLRPRQLQAIRGIKEAIREGYKRIVLQLPTGGGKTLTAAHIIAGSLSKGGRPLFTCPAISLVDQTLRAFEAEGIHDIGILQAQHERTNLHATVQIATLQTLERRGCPEVSLAIIDECHESRDSFNALLDSPEWADKIVIGLSATPWTKGMGLRWKKLVIAGTINDLIADGHAVPTRLWVGQKEIDRSAIGIQAGEFKEAPSAEAMSNAEIIGDVIKEWNEKSTHEKTFAFCVNRKHAQAQVEAFRDSGIEFGYIDAFTDSESRRRQFAQMRAGDIAGIASVGCLIRGVDEDVRCILDLQPTRSEKQHVQKWGRGVRCAPGKDFLIGLDLAGNNLALGLFTDIYHDKLDCRQPEEKGESYKDEYKPAKPRKCPQCNTLIAPGLRACPGCNARLPLDHGVKTVNGRLVEIGSGPKINWKERQDWYSGFLYIEKRARFKEGWAKMQYRDRFEEWPSGELRVRGKKPSPEIQKFVREKQKAYVAKLAEPPSDSQRNTASRLGIAVPEGATRGEISRALETHYAERRLI